MLKTKRCYVAINYVVLRQDMPVVFCVYKYMIFGPVRNEDGSWRIRMNHEPKEFKTQI